MRTRYRTEIEAVSSAHALPPDLVEAVVLAESSGRTYAYRYEPAFWAKYMAAHPDYMHTNPERTAASYGLMQVMFVVAREMKYDSPQPEYLFVPSIGLEYGCRKLAQLMAWSGGEFERALAAYNGGRKANEKPPYRNQAYADRVMKFYRELRA